MTEYSESIKNLLALAEEQQLEGDIGQTLSYLDQANELDATAKSDDFYLNKLIGQSHFDLARQLLSEHEVFLRFAQQHRIIAFWEFLDSCELYLTLDQTYASLLELDYQFTHTEQNKWIELQEKMAEVPVNESKLDRLTQQLALSDHPEYHLNANTFVELQQLTPEAFVQVMKVALLNPLLPSMLRMKLLGGLRELSQDYSLNLSWRGEQRLLHTKEIPTFDQNEFFIAMSQRLSQMMDGIGDIDFSELKFIQSRMVTYILLTFPFTDKEMKPVSDWISLLFTNKIPETVTSEIRQNMLFWQKKEQQIVDKLSN